jgi:hypothetical protein
MEHHICVVNLPKHVGCLDEAHDLIYKIPLELDPCIWGALLGGCRVHFNAKLGECEVACLFELKPQKSKDIFFWFNISTITDKWMMY